MPAQVGSELGLGRFGAYVGLLCDKKKLNQRWESAKEAQSRESQEGREDSNATGEKGSFYESRQKVTITKGNQEATENNRNINYGPKDLLAGGREIKHKNNKSNQRPERHCQRD
jgi:hypothetical protein